MKLKEDQIEKIRGISGNFIKIRDRISDVENRINELKVESDLLITRLQNQRSEEFDFIKDLYSQYGPGKLDPSLMEWVNENENENA